MQAEPGLKLFIGLADSPAVRMEFLPQGGSGKGVHDNEAVETVDFHSAEQSGRGG